jgi:hypothetical protein
VCLYLYRGDNALPAVAVMAGAAVAAMLVMRARGGHLQATRYFREPLARPSAIVIACSALSLALLLAMRIAAAGGVAYYPYPTAAVPELHPLAVLAFLCLLAPALYLAASRAVEERGDD